MPILAISTIRREQILVGILITLVLIIIVIIIVDIIIPKFFKQEKIEKGPQPPAFLNIPLPSLEKIEEAIANPKISELKFYHPISGEIGAAKPETLEELAKKVKVEKMGRPNPFIPFEE